MASIRRLKSGKWIATIRRSGCPSSSRTFRLRSEAAHWVAHVETISRCQSTPRQPDELKVKDLMQWFLDVKIPLYRSQKTARGICRKICEHLGDHDLRRLSSGIVANYRDQRLKERLSGGSVIREMNLLSRAIKMGNSELNLGLTTNPTLDVQRPSPGPPRDRRPTREEIYRLEQLALATNQEVLALAMLVAIETGMRLGEMHSLQWSDVDLERGVAQLHKTKNGDRRDVPLSTVAKAALGRMKPEAATGPVFRRWKSPDGLKTAWRRLSKKAGIRDLRFHDLRHEAASRFFERGLNQFQVAAITGHKTLQALKRYTHLRAEDLVKLLN